MNQQRGGGRQLTAIEQRKQQEAAMVRDFSQTVDALGSEIVKVIPRGVEVERLQRIAVTAVQKNPDLLTATRESWLTALMHCAQDGLMPDGREAAFVKFKDAVQYMPMVYGLRKKILQSGEISDIFTAVVYEAEFEAGLFEVELGSNPKIVHRPMLGRGDRGDVIAAYSVATFKDGTRSFEVMTAAEIDRVMMVSKTKDRGDGPWKQWYGEMARKTVLRRHSKSLPMSSDLRDVEVETMFDRADFDRALAQRDERTSLPGSGGIPASRQLGTSATSEALDDLEERAEAGAKAEIPNDQTGGDQVDQRGDPADEGDGVDWDGWLQSFTDAVPKQSTKALEKWKEPDDIPPATLKAAEEVIGAELAKQREPDEGDTLPDPKPAAKEEPAAEPAKAAANADTIIDEFKKAALLMDLRSKKAEYDNDIDAMDEVSRNTVMEAFVARETELRQKPR